MPEAIEDYALIGDCQSAALVARNGSIDWLCWPRFDSPACFAALLGGAAHGHWRIAPSGAVRTSTRRYRDGTMVLETDYETDEGAVTLIDFMPMRETVADLVRIVVGRRGRVALRMDMALRFDSGEIVPWVTRLEDGGLRAQSGPDMVVLRTPAVLRGDGLTTVAEFTIEAGATIPFVLTYSPSHLPVPAARDAVAALEETAQHWRDWTRQAAVPGSYGEAARRSLLTVRALTFEPTGGSLGAATTTPQAEPGDLPRLDLRGCSLAHANQTVVALLGAGYIEEAHAGQAWVQRAIAGSPDQIQLVYTVLGARRLGQARAGNGTSGSAATPRMAAPRRQFEAAGEVMDTLHHARDAGLVADGQVWKMQIALVGHIERIWLDADEGYWNTEPEIQDETYSRLMAWVALDRAVRDAEMHELASPLTRWRNLRAEIHDDVCSRAYDPKRATFVARPGSKELDPRLLRMAILGFLPAEDARIRGTVAALEKKLTPDGVLLREPDRAQTSADGYDLACSFWLVENRVLQGRQADAQALFERLLALRNDVGLLPARVDAATGRALDCLPHAFAHLALLRAAASLARRAADEPRTVRSPAKAPPPSAQAKRDALEPQEGSCRNG